MDTKTSRGNDILKEIESRSIKIKNELDKQQVIKLTESYNFFKQQIEETEEIKNIFAKRIALGEKYLYYLKSGRGSLGTNILNRNEENYTVEELKLIFETTTYGDKILIDLLKEKFPSPFVIENHVEYDSFKNKYYWDDYVIKIKLEESQNNTICIIV